jgi:hypothetical protein
MATLQAGVNTVGCTLRQEQVTDKKEYHASTMPSVRQALPSLSDDYKFTESSRTEIATLRRVATLSLGLYRRYSTPADSIYLPPLYTVPHTPALDTTIGSTTPAQGAPAVTHT